jgi:hypothetical protein
MINNRPVCDVRPYVDDMFYIADDMCSMLDALDALCKAYPKTDTQWRTESFLPYVRSLDTDIQGKLKGLLDITGRSNLPPEVRNEAQSLRDDIELVKIWIQGLILRAKSDSVTSAPTK